MTDRSTETVGTHVMARGSQRSAVARVTGGQVLGAVGSAIGGAASARKGATGPLDVGQMGYVSVGADDMTVYAAKRALVGKPKVSDRVVARMPLSAVDGAGFEKGRIISALEVAFGDGTAWAFDVVRAWNDTARKVVSTIAPEGGGRP